MTDEIFTVIKIDNNNRRKAVRYISSHNHKAIITLKQLLSPSKYIHAKIINICSKGVRISSKYKFKAKTSIIFNFKIIKAESWKIPAKVVESYDNSEYGIFFDTIQHDLVDQILKHEADLSIT